ncbi:MAG: hypothetical protein KBE23_07320 [Chloroflexi bacterium]|nr:hypothetical protein [Chloroflexota bacterium]MBP7042538.1 hypothetical protein [Chloroflexota bacterium]
MNGIELEFSNQVTVVRLNAYEPENERIQEQLGVRGHPSSVVLAQDDVITERFLGPVSAEALREALIAVMP